MTIKVFYRKCSTCGKGMNEGYVAEMDGQYACSDKCWFTAGYTPAMYAIDYEEGDAYHTTWGEGDEVDVAYTKEGGDHRPLFQVPRPAIH